MTAPAALVAALVDLAPAYGYDRIPLGLFLAQSDLETGGWTSDLFTVANNAWGMKLATVRPTPAVGTYAGHARYDTVRDSVVDYLDRQRAFGIPNDPARYMAATVASGYATDPDYLAKWRARAGLPTPSEELARTGLLLLLLTAPQWTARHPFRS